MVQKSDAVLLHHIVASLFCIIFLHHRKRAIYPPGVCATDSHTLIRRVSSKPNQLTNPHGCAIIKCGVMKLSTSYALIAVILAPVGIALVLLRPLRKNWQRYILTNGIDN